jgi:hypothetical protein
MVLSEPPFEGMKTTNENLCRNEACATEQKKYNHREPVSGISPVGIQSVRRDRTLESTRHARHWCIAYAPSVQLSNESSDSRQPPSGWEQMTTTGLGYRNRQKRGPIWSRADPSICAAIRLQSSFCTEFLWRWVKFFLRVHIYLRNASLPSMPYQMPTLSPITSYPNSPHADTPSSPAPPDSSLSPYSPDPSSPGAPPPTLESVHRSSPQSSPPEAPHSYYSQY